MVSLPHCIPRCSIAAFQWPACATAVPETPRDCLQPVAALVRRALVALGYEFQELSSNALLAVLPHEKCVPGDCLREGATACHRMSSCLFGGWWAIWGSRSFGGGGGGMRRSQRRLDRRLEEVAKAVGGGYCRLPKPLRLALAASGTVAGHRLGVLEGGGGGGASNASSVPCSALQTSTTADVGVLGSA